MDEIELARLASAQPAQPRLDYDPAPCACAPCSAYRACVSPMFLVVWGIVAVNYLPYVVWYPLRTASWSCCIVVFHALVGLLLASYLMTVFTDPGTVPPEWHRAVAADRRLAADHRYCTKSGLYRPLRSHYCSVTRRVVLNLDHFCPWVVNAVGFYNRKFFVLFLLYTLLSCSWVLLTLLPSLLDVGALLAGDAPSPLPSPLHSTAAVRHRAVAGRSPHPISGFGWGPNRYMVVAMALMVDATLVLMLLCFFSFHAHMVLRNETTIEVGHFRDTSATLPRHSRGTSRDPPRDTSRDPPETLPRPPLPLPRHFPRPSRGTPCHHSRGTPEALPRRFQDTSMTRPRARRRGSTSAGGATPRACSGATRGCGCCPCGAAARRATACTGPCCVSAARGRARRTTWRRHPRS